MKSDLDVASSSARPRAAEFPSAVLTMAEAAWASGLSREVLEKCVRDGELAVRRVSRRGRVEPVVALCDLERVHAAHVRDAAERADESSALRERVARLEGELATSERVERSLQRYADRLEERSAEREQQLSLDLSESRKREMTLARALGQAEAKLAQLQAIAAPGEQSEGRTLDEAPRRSKRRR